MPEPVAQRWLWVTPAVTTHRSTGALVYSLSLAEAVADQGIDVTCVGLGAGASESRPGLTYVPVDSSSRPSWQRLFSVNPNQTAATSVAPFRHRVNEMLFDSWDAVVIDGLQVAWVTPMLADDRGGCVVYVAHNHEAQMRYGIARATPWTSARRPLLQLDAHRTGRTERATLRRADVVSSISVEDLECFEADAPDARHVLVRPGWISNERRRPAEMDARPRRVGILGSFEWRPKQEGLRRFLLVADPVFAQAGIDIVVAGNVPPGFRQALAAELRATRFLGWVEDSAEVLGSCRVGVIAEPLGGGFKLKALDYVFNDVAVATLSHSSAGLPFDAGSSMIVADDEHALTNAIVDVIDDAVLLQRLVAEAREIATVEFSWSAAARALVDAVTTRD